MNATRERVLLVDDDPDLLDGLARQHGRAYDVTVARGPELGLSLLAGGEPFAVVVSDYQMPKMNGIEFLQRAREVVPETIRVMLTGQADVSTAIDAVNRGAIFRFLEKPCETDAFRGCLDAAIEQHRLRNAERILLERTVRGSIEVLAEVLSLANPTAFGRATRIRKYVQHIVASLRLPKRWQYETAALLSQIGCIAVPNDLFDKLAAGTPLTPEQASMMERHPEIARELLQKIPHLEAVATIVGNQRSPTEGRDSAGLGSRILAAALDFEELLSVGATHRQAIKAMRHDVGRYDSSIVDALATARDLTRESAMRLLSLGQLREGVLLEEDVRDRGGMLIVSRGHELTASSIARLRNYGHLDLLTKREFRVRLPQGEGPSSAVA